MASPRSIAHEMLQPGVVTLLTLTTQWDVVRSGDAIIGDFSRAIPVLRIQKLLQSLAIQFEQSRPECLREARLRVLHHVGFHQIDQIGGVVMVIPEPGRRFSTTNAKAAASELTAALEVLRSEAYALQANQDLVDRARGPVKARPLWLGPAQKFDPTRAALVRAGRGRLLTLRARDDRSDPFEVPTLPLTEPERQGEILLQGTVASMSDTSQSVKLQAERHDTPKPGSSLEVKGRTFNCRVQDGTVYSRIRSTPASKVLTFRVTVHDAVRDGGTLVRTFNVVALE